VVELRFCKPVVKGSTPLASSTVSLLQDVLFFLRSRAILKHASNLIWGEIPKWPNGADCKSAGSAYRGSSPLLPTNPSGCSSVVEPQPSKLVARVRFPSPAPFTRYCSSGVEHFIGNEEVTSSNLVSSSITEPKFDSSRSLNTI
jgi:hypothetical protein